MIDNPADRCHGVLVGLAVGDRIAVRETGGFAGQEGQGNKGGYAPHVLRVALFFVGTSACFTGR